MPILGLRTCAPVINAPGKSRNSGPRTQSLAVRSGNHPTIPDPVLCFFPDIGRTEHHGKQGGGRGTQAGGMGGNPAAQDCTLFRVAFRETPGVGATLCRGDFRPGRGGPVQRPPPCLGTESATPSASRRNPPHPHDGAARRHPPGWAPKNWSIENEMVFGQRKETIDEEEASHDRADHPHPAGS